MPLAAVIDEALAALGVQLPGAWSSLTNSSVVNVPTLFATEDGWETRGVGGGVTFSRGNLARQGNYGMLWEVVRTDRDGQESVVFLKADTENRGLLHEALLQLFARCALERAGCPEAVPRVIDILAHPKRGVVFTMNPILNATVLPTYLEQHLDWNVRSVKNDRVLWRVVAQVALYCWILEEELGLNHRDLKGTNVLVMVPRDSPTHEVKFKGRRVRITSDATACLIDFGFACRGSAERVLQQSASVRHQGFDFCPKEGRDLFLFLALFWMEVGLRGCLSLDGVEMMERWLGPKKALQIARHSEVDEEDCMERLYLNNFLPEFRRVETAPLTVLMDIAAVAPDVVTLD